MQLYLVHVNSIMLMVESEVSYLLLDDGRTHCLRKMIRRDRLADWCIGHFLFVWSDN